MRPVRFGASLIVALIAVLLGLTEAQAQTRQYSPSFTVGGQVNTPQSYTLQDLQVLPSMDLEVDYTAAGQPEHSTYTGVRLLDLLMAAGPQFDLSRRNESLRWYILVTATDSYQAVISWGEIDPNFGAKDVLIAYQEDGQPLGQGDGMARLVVPGDKHGGRYVSNIQAISLVRASGDSMPTPASSPSPVKAYFAGSLNAAVTTDIGPSFTAATGYPLSNVRGPSVALANQIQAGQIQPDVFMSADAEVNDQVLMGARNGDLVSWYFIMCRQQMVIAYSPASRFKEDFEAAAAGAKPWYEVLQTPGLALKRYDPRNDPGGYRGVFLFQLAERHYGLPGLKEQLIGQDDNEGQILNGDDAAALKEGTVDAVVTYLTQAILNDLPYVTLPAEVDQSDPTLGPLYATATYTNPQGQVFHGSPLVYSVTIPRGAANPAGAEAFVRYLLSEPGQAALTRRGFSPAEALVAGDESAVPESLRSLIHGHYSLPTP